MRFFKYSLIFLGISIHGFSQVNPNRIPLSTLDFLLYPSDANSMSLGMGALASIPNDLNWTNNFSSTPFLKEKLGINTSFNPIAHSLISDMSLVQINSFHQVQQNDKFVFGLKYFDGGKIDLRDDFGNSMGIFNSFQLAVQTGYALKFSENWSGGLQVRYINSHLLPKQIFGNFNIRPLNTFNGDLSLFYKGDLSKTNSWTGALLIQNIGPKLSWGDVKNTNFQPTIFKIGGGYHRKMASNILSFNLDFHKMLVPTPPLRNNEGRVIKGKDLSKTDALSAIFSSWTDAPSGFKEELSEIMFSIGAEFNHSDKLKGRIGFFNDSKRKGNRQLLTFGGGIHQIKLKDTQWQLGLGAAYVLSISDFSPIGNTYILSLNISKKKTEE